ncbi:MAG: glycoside hydrolase family 32 protein [Thermogutta sp.]|nr:glycoside hydrolase family 32 protein [Thermogutta sp.]HQF14690.1 glycoside hydrolase family 32 protein [Thermogutta sp.]
MRRIAVGLFLVALIALAGFPWAGAEDAVVRPDIVLDDFERETYAPWIAEGEAFGPGPAAGTLPRQMEVTGYHGQRLVNSYYNGDGTVGTLTSPPFTLQRHYLAFLIGGGGYHDETYMELVVDGQSVRRAVGPNTAPGGSEELDWAVWDVRELEGKTAVIRIVDRRTGGWGHINVDYIVQTDRPPEQLLQPLETRVTQRYFLLPVAGNGPRTHCRIIHKDNVVRYFDIQIAEDDSQIRFWASIDLQGLEGEIVSWFIRPRAARDLVAKCLVQSNAPRWPPNLYHEAFRPQFHFSPRVGWTNDPNGLVYYDGEYHLFFQHNPFGIPWGNMTWGHAVSRDLVHWEELGDAILPDERGTIYSGSAVVDINNTSGLGKKENPAMCAFYTAAGQHSYQPCPFTQCMAYSLDRGRTWTKFSGNPVVNFIADGNRDPKVFWHKETQRWIMVLYVRRDAFSIFSSPNLKEWRFETEVPFPTAHECPELFELPVNGNPQDTRWVLWSASGNHMIGRFDGHTFKPESEVLRSEWGKNCYAGQTWNEVPDGRRLFIGWMNSDGSAYPGMPFNQQMTIPREFTLRTTEQGLRLFAWPVKELERIRREKVAVKEIRLVEGSPYELTLGELLDIQLAVKPATAKVVTINVRGISLEYRPQDGVLACLGAQAGDLPKTDVFDLRMLVDRTSLEVFVLGGRYVMSFCWPFDAANRTVRLEAHGGNAEVVSLEGYRLASIWEE